MTSLTPSDIVHGVIIANLIEGARENLTQPSNALQVLCYLSDAISLPTAKQYVSFASLLACYIEIVSLNNDLKNVVNKLLLGGKNIDTFFTVIETIKSTIATAMTSNTLSFNELSGPVLITPDSHLGIFVRSVVAKWECMRFDELCVLFEQVQVFLTFSSTERSEVNEDYNSYVVNDLLGIYNGNNNTRARVQIDSSSLVQKALHYNDISVVEHALHCMHDISGSDPLTSLGGSMNSTSLAASAVEGKTSTETGGGTGNETVGGPSNAAMLRALAAVMRTTESTGSSSSSSKHQHVMLSLASMWLRADNLVMALAAIEEALKIAHQRGDHAAVAHALLLLQAVFTASQEPDLVASGEDILMRCLKRCASLGLQQLTAQCTLLLATLRAHQPLSCTGLSIGIDGVGAHAMDEDEDHIGSASHTQSLQLQQLVPKWCFGDVWAQLNFVQLGEISLSCQVVTPTGIVEDFEFNQSSASSNQLQQPLNGSNNSMVNGGKKDSTSSSDGPLPEGRTLAQLNLQCSLVGCALWFRAGMLPMAEFWCRRAIRQVSQQLEQLIRPSIITTTAAVKPSQTAVQCEEFVTVYCKLLLLQTDVQHYCAIECGSECESDAQYTSLLMFDTQVRRLLLMPDHVARSAHIALQLDSARHYLLVHASMAKKQWSRALRLAGRLVEQTSSHSSVSSITVSSSSRTLEVEENAIYNNTSNISETNIQARILLAQVMAEFDVESSQQMLVELAGRCKAQNNTLWYCMCRALRAVQLLKQSNNMKQQSSSAYTHALVRQSLLESRKLGVGLAEMYIARCLHVDSLACF